MCLERVTRASVHCCFRSTEDQAKKYVTYIRLILVEMLFPGFLKKNIFSLILSVKRNRVQYSEQCSEFITFTHGRNFDDYSELRNFGQCSEFIYICYSQYISKRLRYFLGRLV